MYDVMSPHAADFIDDAEINATLQYAAENAGNKALIEDILAKAEECKGLNHREALVLLDCTIPELNARILELAGKIKERFYGNRIVMFAPLYLSNYCINGCIYCPYHGQNKTIARKKLSQAEIRDEVIALQDMGHKRLALETGDPRDGGAWWAAIYGVAQSRTWLKRFSSSSSMQNLYKPVSRR